MPTLETHDGYPLWRYIPSLPAAILFIILFSGATGFHTFKMFRNRTWFCSPLIIGGLFEIIGYVGRALAYNRTGELGPYIMQSVLLLLAPVLFAATLYMTLGRIIVAVGGNKCSFISPRWLTFVFVFGDCLAFLVQAGGAGLIVKSDVNSVHVGGDIIVGGLVFQVIMFGLFCSVAASFNVRFRRFSTALRGEAATIPWQKALNMLYVTSACILVRNIFRVVEYALGQNGYALTHEWCLYVFDGCLMLVVMATFGGYSYPSNIVRKSSRNVGRESGGSEQELTEVGKLRKERWFGWR